MFPNKLSPSNQELREIVETYEKSQEKAFQVQPPNLSTSLDDLKELPSTEIGLKTETAQASLSQDEENSFDPYDESVDLWREAKLEAINFDLRRILNDR